jgi:hypothetical protein
VSNNLGVVGDTLGRVGDRKDEQAPLPAEHKTLIFLYFEICCFRPQHLGLFCLVGLQGDH